MIIPDCKCCKKRFNLTQNQPLFLPKCGHTLCSGCIRDLLSRSENGQFKCPEDNEVIQQDMTLADFKVNKGMEDLVKNKEVRYCDIHNKVLEFYCTDDREEICAHCGIKGDHQKCSKIITIKELQNVNNYLMKEIFEKINKIVFVEEFKKYPKVKALINQKIEKIIQVAKDRVMAQYHEIKNSIKKYILTTFTDYEKKIHNQIDLCFSDKEESYKQLTKKIQHFQKELVFMQRMNKKNNDNYSQIYSKLLDLRRDFRETEQNHSDLTEQLQKMKSTDLEMDWSQSSGVFKINISAKMQLDTPNFEMKQVPSHSDDFEAIQMQKQSSLSQQRKNSSFLKNNLSKFDQDVSPIPQDNDRRQGFKYKTITNIDPQNEKSNYRHEVDNLHVSMDPVTLKELNRRKKTGMTRNSSIRSNGYSVSTNFQSTRKLTLKDNSQREASQRTKYNKLRRIDSMKLPNKSMMRLKTKSNLVEYRNQEIDYNQFMQKMVEALQNAQVDRINFRDNIFVDDIFPILDKVFTTSFKRRLTIDLRKNNLTLTPQNQYIIKNLQAKNIFVNL